MSEETSALVTLTEARRRSSISNPINSASSSLTASDTRRARCSSIFLPPLGFGANQHRSRQMRRFALHSLQNLFGEGPAGGNRRDGEYGAVVEIHVVDFGHRDVELAAQAVLEALHHVTL